MAAQDEMLTRSLPGIGVGLGAGAGLAIGVAVAGGPGLVVGSAASAARRPREDAGDEGPPRP